MHPVYPVNPVKINFSLCLLWLINFRVLFMGNIKVLSQNLVNKIAAGEVIERPASVVKELIENSIDAHASIITISFDNMGKDIKVVDDGIGMDEDDVKLAMLRHSTSKISSEEDLFNIQTKGFRGEALASIASVTHLEIISRAKDSLQGIKLKIKGGEVENISTIGAPVGTTISIRHLFYNTPARLKFLKSEVTETQQIIQTIIKQALAHPEVGFKVVKNDKPYFDLPANQDLLSRIISLLGSQVKDNLLEVRLEISPVRIEGYVSKPELTRNDKRYQFLFVNDRPIYNQSIGYAISEAYKTLIPQGRFPIVVIKIYLPNNLVDVNVHPTKAEVRFSNNNLIKTAVYRAIFEVLESSDLSIKLKLKREKDKKTNEHPLSAFSAKDESEIIDKENLLYKKFQQTVIGQVDKLEDKEKRESDFQVLFRNKKLEETGQGIEEREIQKKDEVEVSAETKEVQSEENFSDLMRQEIQFEPEFEAEEIIPLGQVGKTYIVAQKGDDLVLIDQHAAHERVIYQGLQKRIGSISIQPLLFPITTDVPVTSAHIIELLIPELKKYGIEIEHFGGNTFLISGVPSDVPNLDVEGFLQDIVDDFSEKESLVERDQVRNRILTRIACRSAIKSGQNLSREEMREIIKLMGQTRLVYTCPHGRPTIIVITKEQLDKNFKRK